MNDRNQLGTNGQMEEDSLSLKDYLKLIRQNLVPIILITIAALAVAVFYALNATDIYSSTTTVKIRQPQGNILEAPLIPEFQDYGSDRFIANEIEVMKSYNTRIRVAQAFLDSFRIVNEPSKFHLIFEEPELALKTDLPALKSPEDIAAMLGENGGLISIEQKRGLDIVEITVESPSASEAALIANLYADSYYDINLEYNREQLISVRKFLEEQRREKLDELLFAEEQLKNYQEERGVVDLTEQSRALIEQLTNFEAQRDATKIEMTISERSLEQYKNELENQDPRIKDYLESFAAEPYIKQLQAQIAQLQSQKDLAIADIEQERNNAEIIKQYDQKIEDLKQKLNEQIQVYKAGIFASNPEQIQELTQKVLEEEVKYQSLLSSYNDLNDLVERYERRFEEMPKRTLDFVRLQRTQSANEKLYLLVEEKYQEAQINERSAPGNAVIIDEGRVPGNPAKPNRKLIITLGLVIGLGLGIGFAFVRNYFDNTIKTPEDIQNKNISLLAWIPSFATEGNKTSSDLQFIVNKKSDSTASEAYRALRTRIRYSGIDGKTPKKILVTSSSAGEGKTTTSINLAGSFAQANQKTLLIDCDLRKPGTHKVFGTDRYPGFVDYFFNQASFDELIRKTEMTNLYYITGGTIPPNPAEIIGSQQMEEFIKKIENHFDVIIFDSPPLIAVTDSEILSRIVDGVILVVSAGVTEIEMLYKSLDIINISKTNFLGTVLNNFSYRPGYGAYYKYYYYYYNSNNGKDQKKILSRT